MKQEVHGFEEPAAERLSEERSWAATLAPVRGRHRCTNASPSGWKCYAATTADRPERRIHLERELERSGLPYHIRISIRPSEANGFPSAGYRGCFESHLANLRMARDEGVDVAVLVEDDVVIVRGLSPLLGDLVAEARSLEWSMIYLGYLSKGSPNRRDQLELVTAHIARSVGWEVYGSHFVGVNSSSFDTLIENFEARLRPSGHRISPDGVLNEYRRDRSVDTLLCVPNLARQGPSPSGISSGRGIKTTLLANPTARAVVEEVKRRGWDAQSRIAPPVTVRLWNLRSRWLRRLSTPVSASRR